MNCFNFRDVETWNVETCERTWELRNYVWPVVCMQTRAWACCHRECVYYCSFISRLEFESSYKWTSRFLCPYVMIGQRWSHYYFHAFVCRYENS